MASKPIRWGVLGVAKIAMDKVLPAILQSPQIAVTAIASRSAGKAQAAAARLGIPRACGSYEALLADPEVDAIYNPLPNTLHAEWTIRALEAGKHVLCEKPLAPTVAEVERMQQTATRLDLIATEAFMVFSHPRIRAIRELIRSGAIGRLGLVQMSFSNPNFDPANIRNRTETGGGGILDKGCYAVALARYLFEAEPMAVTGASEIHANFGTDQLTAGILKFADGMATFDCSTRLAVRQHLTALGSDGYLDIDVPVTPDPEQPSVIRIVTPQGVREQQLPPANAYRMMFEEVSTAIRQRSEPPVSSAFSLGNARAVAAIIEAAGRWRWNAL